MNANFGGPRSRDRNIGNHNVVKIDLLINQKRMDVKS